MHTGPWQSRDEDGSSILALFDVLATFDTINNGVFLEHLRGKGGRSIVLAMGILVLSGLVLIGGISYVLALWGATGLNAFIFIIYMKPVEVVIQ